MRVPRFLAQSRIHRACLLLEGVGIVGSVIQRVHVGSILRGSDDLLPFLVVDSGLPKPIEVNHIGKGLRNDLAVRKKR